MTSVHVSHSQLAAFTSCSQKWAFRYVDKLRSRASSSEPLRRGTLYHEGMNAAYCEWMKPGATVDRIVEAGAMRVECYGNEHGDECDDGMIDLVSAMVRRSMHEILDDEFGRLVPVASELEFSVGIKGVRGISMFGYIDAVMLSRAERTLIINEHKQTGGRVEGVERRVAFDPQISTYVDALRKIVDSGGLSAALWALGIEDAKSLRIGPVMYNVARAAKPHKANILKDGTVSVAKIDTLPNVYQQQLDEQAKPAWLTKFDGVDPLDEPKAAKANDRWRAVIKKQSELLAMLENNVGSYFGRFEVYRSPGVMDEWRTDMVRNVKRLRRALRTLEVERSPSTCSMPWSMKCEYSDICLDRSDEGIRKALFTTEDERETETEVNEAPSSTSEDFNF